MSDAPTITNRGPGQRRRALKPACIDIGSDDLIRNDIVATEDGVSERTLNRGDAKGDPFIYIGGVKYRPRRGHHEFRASQIQRRSQAPRRTRRVRS